MTSWRTPLVLVVAALSAPAAALAAFVAVVEWTGCFLSCDGSDVDRVTGGLLGALAVALVLSGPALGWRLRRGGGVVVAGAGLLLGLAGTGVLLGVQG